MDRKKKLMTTAGFEPATFSSFHHSALPLSYVVIPLRSKQLMINPRKNQFFFDYQPQKQKVQSQG